MDFREPQVQYMRKSLRLPARDHIPGCRERAGRSRSHSRSTSLAPSSDNNWFARTLSGIAHCDSGNCHIPSLLVNWLRVLGTTELPHIDQGIRQQFHAKMSLLPVFETQEEPLEFILPGECPIDTRPQRMDGGIE
jgi:hypothetical protein